MRTEDEQILQDWIPSGDIITRLFNHENMIAFSKHYENQKRDKNIFDLDHVSHRRNLYFAFMEEYNSLMGKGEYQILKEEVEVLLSKYSA